MPVTPFLIHETPLGTNKSHSLARRVLFFHRKLHLDPPLDTDVNCRLCQRTENGAAAVLLMNGSGGGACVERRRRVNEIIEEREERKRGESGRAAGEPTAACGFTRLVCVVDMDTIIIACGLE